MKTTGVMRAVCAAAVVLWTSVGFADDLTNLLRLVQAVAQDRSNASRADRGGRDRSMNEDWPVAGRTSRDTWKRTQEQDFRGPDFSQGPDFGDRGYVAEDWQDRFPERSSRSTSRNRAPVAPTRPVTPTPGRSRISRVDPRSGRDFERDLHGSSQFDEHRYDEHRYDEHRFGSDYGYSGNLRYDERRSVELSLSYGSGGFRTDYGVPRVVPVPRPQHHVGEIVCCRVPLVTVVRVKGADNICRHAVPAIVAVRDPNLCSHDVIERVVYVQVMVPPCPPRKVEISPCHTRVKLCFDDYEVEITSKSGVISVEYDD